MALINDNFALKGGRVRIFAAPMGEGFGFSMEAAHHFLSPSRL